MTDTSQILVVAPDRGFRRSLEFALEVEGFAVLSCEHLATAITSPHAAEIACVLIDEDAILEDPFAMTAVQQFDRPTLLLIDRSIPLSQLQGVRFLRKPVLGNALINAVRSAVENRDDGAKSTWKPVST